MNNEDLLRTLGRVEKWMSMNSTARYRSAGGIRLIRRVIETDVPALLAEVERLQSIVSLSTQVLPETPDLTRPPGYFIAARDRNGNIRLNNGKGLLVAMKDVTRSDVLRWLEMATKERFRNQYEAALRLLDQEYAEGIVAGIKEREKR